MSVQAAEDSTDPYSGLTRAPQFATHKKDVAGSRNKALGRVHYAEDDESAPLLAQSTSSLTSSEVNQGFLSNPPEDEAKRRRRWKSIYVMYITMFLTALTFSIVISSIWPYLLQVDYKNSTTKFLGWVVASYSFGQLVASPFFGTWADYRPTREPLIVATIINVTFNVLYSYLGAFGGGVAGWMMILSRTLIGFGAGIGAVCRSYVSEATTQQERIGAMAAIGAAQALGFIVGPVLGLAFVPLGYNGVAIPAIKFRLNMYTGPGFLGAILGVLNIILLAILFREARLVNRKAKRKMQQRKELMDRNTQKAVVSDSIIAPPSSSQQCFDVYAATASIIVFFVILSCFSVFETLLTPLTMDEFAWTKKEAVLYNNIFFAGLSFITITTLFSVKYITEKVDERVVLMVGMFLLAFAFFALIPMGSQPPKVVTMSTLTGSDYIDDSVIPSYSMTDTNETIEAVGCRDPPQDWCTKIPAIHFAQLMICLLLVTPGYAATSVTIFSIYSKVLGPIRQGVMMGLLTAAGSLARGLGPMALSMLYQHYGPYITFGTVVGTLATTILFILVSSPRLVPYQNYTRRKKVFVQLPEGQD